MRSRDMRIQAAKERMKARAEGKLKPKAKSKIKLTAKQKAYRSWCSRKYNPTSQGKCRLSGYSRKVAYTGDKDVAKKYCCRKPLKKKSPKMPADFWGSSEKYSSKTSSSAAVPAGFWRVGKKGGRKAKYSKKEAAYRKWCPLGNDNSKTTFPSNKHLMLKGDMSGVKCSSVDHPRLYKYNGSKAILKDTYCCKKALKKKGRKKGSKNKK